MYQPTRSGPAGIPALRSAVVNATANAAGSKR